MNLSPEQAKAAVKSIEKDLSFLEDNCYRYQLDAGDTDKHRDEIWDHKTKISTLKMARDVLLALGKE